MRSEVWGECGASARARNPRRSGFGHHSLRYYGRGARCCRWTGTSRAGNARLILDPRKHGLELSQGVTALARAAVRRRKASAPRKQMSAQIAYTCLRGAQPRPGIGRR